MICEPLPRSRPLWSATFVTGLADGGTGLVVVMNHVLADGIGGLAVLARLVDEGPARRPEARRRAAFPAPPPGRARSPPMPGPAGRAASPTRRAACARSGRAWPSWAAPVRLAGCPGRR